MNMLVFEGGVVKPSRLGEAQAWLSQNDAEMRSSAPDGTTYLGVYTPIFSSAKYPTEVFVVYSVEKYGDLDRLVGAEELIAENAVGPCFELFDRPAAFVDEDGECLGIIEPVHDVGGPVYRQVFSQSERVDEPSYPLASLLDDPFHTSATSGSTEAA